MWPQVKPTGDIDEVKVPRDPGPDGLFVTVVGEGGREKDSKIKVKNKRYEDL